MKKQLFYRSPDINENSGWNDEQPVDETTTDSGNDTSGEDGATDEDDTSGNDTSGEDGATDEDDTSGDDTSGEDDATDEDDTSGNDTNGEDGATDEDNISGDDTNGEDDATDKDNTSGDDTSGEDGATDEDNTSGDDTNGEDGATDEDNTFGDDTSGEDGATDEDDTSGDDTSGEDGATDEDDTSGDDTSGEDGATDEDNTEDQESGNEESNTEEGNNTEGEETGNKENNTEEGNNTEGQEIEHGENNTEGDETGNEATNTFISPPVAIAWPGSLSSSPATTPGDELATFITTIKSNRANVPEHLTDKNKVKNGYMYDPFAGKPQPQPASIQPDTVDAWIWDELRSEGSYTSINTYDNMIVTWGRGVAGANIAKVLKSIFSTHSDIQTEFNNIGIGLNANGILQVVDTNQNCIKEAGFALQTIKADKKLLDFLVDISLNDNYKEVFLDAQWNFVKTFNASLFAHVSANKWSKDAVQLMFHFNWWLPAYAWNGHSQNYKDTGGDVHKIIYIFAGNLNKNSILVGYLKKFAGNVFSKYVAKQEYETQPAGEHIVFEDGVKKYYYPKL